jgi:glutamate racemase
MNTRNLIFALSVLLIVSCKQNQSKKESDQVEVNKGDILNTIINDKENFYHVDFNNYPSGNTSLPNEVFDSGTGGLTVLKAIVNYDQNRNERHQNGSDGVIHFDK